MYRFKTSVLSVLIVFFFAACKKETNANFTLKGAIKDLKKGMVYLQKNGDSTIINLDSMEINGQTEFKLQTNLDEPLLLYLKLDKKDGNEYYIPFFADQGVTSIQTTLKGFTSDAKITGTPQQELLETYLKLMSDFKNKNLDLIKANVEAIKGKDSLKVDSILKQSERLQRLKYASTINFSLTNKDSEVAAYLALYEIPNTSVKYLDSIYNNLTDAVKESYYGKKLGIALSNYEKSQDSIR